MSANRATPGTTYGTDETAATFDDSFETTTPDDEFEAYPRTFLCETWLC